MKKITSPTQSQHGEPSSTLAAIFWNKGLISGQAYFNYNRINEKQTSLEPPGIKDGPCKAPSSPPETPDPTKWNPLASSSFILLVESLIRSAC